jgi:hypothetical protein
MTRDATLKPVALPTPHAGSTALVTGASSGLGVEIARALARRGYGVTLVARRKDRLDALAAELAEQHGIRAEAIACDLADAGQRDQMVAEVKTRGLTVDILCNNAGYGSAGNFVGIDRETELRMVRLNCEAVIDLCHRYAPAMAGRGGGAILNTASTISFQPTVRQATYCATKAMVRTFTEVLHQELRASGVAVTALCAGGMRTEFIDVADVRAVADSVPDFMMEDPKDVAEAGIRGLEDNRRVVLVSAFSRIGAVAGTYTPNRVLLPLMDKLYPIGR